MTDSSSLERSSRVCENCRTRKRACDKRIPSCSFCSSRGLVCSYVEGLASTNGSFLRLHTAPSTTSKVGHLTFDNDINVQVSNILKSVGLTPKAVKEQYFGEFHRCFPIIAPQAHACSDHPNDSSKNAPADASILLLAMVLVSQHLPIADVIYSSLRQLFVVVQESRSVKVTLIQVSVLIATFEYARGWTEQSFVSVGIALRLAQILGIDQRGDNYSIEHSRRQQGVNSEEAWNLWCGIMILERLGWPQSQMLLLKFL